MKFKKFVLLLVSVIFFFTGCITIQVKNDEAINGIVEIIARRVATNVIKAESPDKLEYVKNKCDEILSMDLEESYPLMETALRYGVARYSGDPLLYDDIISLCKLFGVDLNTPDMDFDMGELRTLRAGLLAFRKVLN